jgi:dihydrofolate reductase
MRKLVWSMLTSLDGFIEGTHGDDWVIADDELHEYSAAQMRAADAILFGRVTYQIFGDFWPTAATNPNSTRGMIDFANAINRSGLGKFVFSKTLDRADWSARLLRDIVPEEIVKMKEQPGQNIEIAGASIGSALAGMGLIDEYELLVHPVVLGSGKPMFKDIRQQLNLKLLETQTFRSGVVVLRYQAA